MPFDPSFRDGLSTGPLRGRGAGLNPGNRFESVRLHVLGDHLDEQRAEHPNGAQCATVTMDDSTHTLINPVDSPDLSMRWTVNPYRGCEHGCIYCYARPGHEYLGLSCGVDFETRILAKRDAPAMLRRELSRPRWKGETIMMSGVTDPYQPIERELRITRACLEVCAEFRQPVAVITKSHLVTRDIDVLRKLHEHRAVGVALSLTTLDASLAAQMEPRASSPRARLDAIREIASAGIPVSVMVAPIIPGLNDHEIPALLDAAAEAGASDAGYVLLRLPHQIKELFLEWLHRCFPARAAKIEHLIRDTRSGALYQSAAFERQRGTGPLADQIRATFAVFAKRAGLAGKHTSLNDAAFRVPDSMRERSLFDAPTLFDE